MKKEYARYLVFGIELLLIAMLTACIDEYHFGKYDQAKIVSFGIENQVGVPNIDHEALMITVLVDESSDLTELMITALEISSFATSNPMQGEVLDFSQPVTILVTAEDGFSQIYTVFVKLSQAEIQLNNSDFQQWYEVGGSKPYFEPGLSKEETIWATGNPGVVTLGAPNVNPMSESDNVFAILKTVELPIGAILSQGIGAGSMFTGFFKLNLSNPIASAKFGTPYSAKPESFRIKYKYSPGTLVKDGKLNPLPQAKDSCDIGIILTDRSAEPYKQVAIAWFRSGDNVTEWKELVMNFKYGLIAQPMSYEKPKDVYVTENGVDRLVTTIYGTGNEKPTHITVVFASSHRGDFFEGAPGSELYVDDLELIYP
ncbi:MAG: PCMD domain-containing protein [Bacteroidales bacterium]|nr:PCMD domain-containing protein [Bacteroidales bacterium]